MPPLTLDQVKSHLAKSSLKKRTKNEHVLNESFFETIDTEEKAYFLGLLMADGCVSTCNNRSWKMSITLASEDDYVLKTLRLRLNPTESSKLGVILPKKANHSPQTRCVVYSNKISYDLIKLNCVPNKSLTLEFPPMDLIPDLLIPHFIRGFFDGDGGWITSKGYKKDWDVRVEGKITSSHAFIATLSGILREKGILNSVYMCNRGRNSRLLMGFYECLKFYQMIYRDATIFLTRKRQTFLDELHRKKERLSTTDINPWVGKRGGQYIVTFHFGTKRLHGGTFKTKQEAQDRCEQIKIEYRNKPNETKTERINMIDECLAFEARETWPHGLPLWENGA